MSKKKKEKTKSPYPENGKVKIRRSYYTFAREFPSKILPLEGKGKRERKRSKIRAVLLSVSFIILTAVSFFTLNLFLDISYTPLEKLPSSELSDGQPLSFGEERVNAFYMPAERLSDSNYIKELIGLIKRKNCNSVVIDFKDSRGKLSYTSLNENAIVARCALFDNNTVRQALDLFEEEKIRVIARVYCFMDNSVPAANPSLAVKYLDTEVNWIDAAADRGGKNRLNPFSSEARKYLLDIISEIADFKIQGILLEEVCFPYGEFASSAYCPGEKKNSDKNAVLHTFVENVKKALPEGCILLLGHSARDVLKANNELYSGSMLSCDADGFAVDTAERDESVIVDKKTDFVSVLSMLSAVKNKIGEKRAVYEIDFSEYSSAYIRKMKKAGYGDFIISSPDGIYN